MAYFQEALKALRPNKEFSTYEDDTVIVWNDETVISPTQEEIDKKIKDLKAEKEAAADFKASAKAALLDRLGITADEATLLLS
jgi:predicted enzyme involved in methoxymalonyl-ACP biosynthesis